MGCADLYCSFCGGPTYSREVFANTKLLKKILGDKKIKKTEKYYNVTPDGNWEDCESILRYIQKYKTPNINDFSELCKSVTIPKTHKWQDNLILITIDKIIKNVKSSFGEVYTTVNNIKYNTYSEELAYLVHNDCYKLIIDKFGKITFNDIDPKICSIANSGIIKKYQGQFFYSSLAFLDNPDFLESPLKNNINKNRILKLKLPIKKIFIKNSKNSKKSKNSKNSKKRQSPSESATLFKVGTKKKGNDGNMWIVKENINKVKKWIKIIK